MKLSGEQVKQIHKALLDGYNLVTLRMMARMELDLALDTIVGGDNASLIVFGLIEWAEKNDRVPQLVAGAYQGNPDNYLIASLAQQGSWYTATQVNGTTISSPEYLEADRQTFRHLMQLLPWSGSIAFVRTYDFTGSRFRRSSLDDFRAFLFRSEDPAFEFLDRELEASRVDLKASVAEFMAIIARYTFPVMGMSDLNEVPKEWRWEQPERFRNMVDGLHKSADHITETYGSLVRLGKRTLGVIPDGPP